MGGCIYLPFEPNTPDIPEIDGVVVDAALFDGSGVIAYNGKYYHINYPQQEDVREDEQIRRVINQHRFGYRLPDHFDITADDLALTFGAIEECEYSEYVSYLIEGLISNASNMSVEDGKRSCLTCDEYISKLQKLESCPPKYLYYFTDRDDLVEQFDGEIYPVYDENKRGDATDGWICDLLLKDLLELEEQGVIRPDKVAELNEPYLVSEEHRAKLLASRFEAIIFINK